MRRVPRRQLLAAGGSAALGGLVLAACGNKSKSDKSTGEAPTTPTTAATRLVGDLKVAALAVSLENLAVNTYQAVLDSVAAGRIASLPPAMMSFLQVAQRHHREHADAWNAVLAGAGRPKVTGVDVVVKPTIDQSLAQVRDGASLARLGLTVESVVAATYVSGLAVLVNTKTIQTAASIHPVEMQHVAILNLVLGQMPVPDSFAKVDLARPTSDSIV